MFVFISEAKICLIFLNYLTFFLFQKVSQIHETQIILRNYFFYCRLKQKYKFFLASLQSVLFCVLILAQFADMKKNKVYPSTLLKMTAFFQKQQQKFLQDLLRFSLEHNTPMHPSWSVGIKIWN